MGTEMYFPEGDTTVSVSSSLSLCFVKASGQRGHKTWICFHFTFIFCVLLLFSFVLCSIWKSYFQNFEQALGVQES